jgi:hypothetical protein
VRARQWLSEIEAGTATVEGIATREACSKRHVHMTIASAIAADQRARKFPGKYALISAAAMGVSAVCIGPLLRFGFPTWGAIAADGEQLSSILAAPRPSTP